jgi:UDP-glucose 4-epimerase
LVLNRNILSIFFYTFAVHIDNLNTMAQKILVTGGTGYIGSHTVVELINAGYKTVIIDDLSNSSADVIDNIEKITGVRPAFEKFDLTDFERVEKFFADNSDIAATIHFAASKAVGESVEKPLLYYRNNLVSLMNLLDCHLKYDVNNIVFSSSCTVYGQPDKLPVTETTPRKDAESPYANTKRVNEDILRDSTVANPRLKGIALRYFNPIGAHPTALIGELPLGVPQNLVPFITQTAAGLRDELKVFGDDYDTPDGSAIRDYINVVDLAKAHVVSIERLLKQKNKENFEVFNLGTGNGYSVLEIIKGFEKVTGVKLNYKIVERRAGDIVKIWADTTYANEELGWKAEKGLEETLLSAWNWEKNVRGMK